MFPLIFPHDSLAFKYCPSKQAHPTMPTLHTLSALRQAKHCVHRLEHSLGARGRERTFASTLKCHGGFQLAKASNISRCTFHAHEGIFQKSKLCFEICIIVGYIAPATLIPSPALCFPNGFWGECVENTVRGKTDWPFSPGLKQ